MHHIQPSLFVLGHTAVDRDGMSAFLHAVGAEEFTTDATSGGEEIVEVAGRLCYKSFKPGLNPNVSKIREGNVPYIGNILKSRHGSVTEHATVNFGILGVTPVLTHELVRHSTGTAISQVSGRYVRIDDLGVFPTSAFKRALAAGAITPEAERELEDMTRDMAEMLDAFQGAMAAVSGIDDMTNFTIKKTLTSAFRRFAPYGLETGLVFTANHRAIRHIIASRVDPIHAEEEIHLLALAMGHEMKARFPALYQDMSLVKVETPWGLEDKWVFDFEKV